MNLNVWCGVVSCGVGVGVGVVQARWRCWPKALGYVSIVQHVLEILRYNRVGIIYQYGNDIEIVHYCNESIYSLKSY